MHVTEKDVSSPHCPGRVLCHSELVSYVYIYFRANLSRRQCQAPSLAAGWEALCGILQRVQNLF